MFRATEVTAVLLPAWIVAYTYRGRTFRHVVNGSTGALHSHAPRSPWKVAGCGALAVFAVAAALLALFAVVIGGM